MAQRAPHQASTRAGAPPHGRRTSIAFAVAQAMMACIVIGSAIGATPAARAQPAESARAYSIPAGSLTAALNRFGREAGIMLSFSTELTGSLQSAGLSDSYTVSAALSALLAGTSLEAVQQGDGGYLVQRVPRVDRATSSPAASTTLPEVTITAAPSEGDSPFHLRKSMSSGALGAASQLDTPFSTTEVTQEDIEDRQISSTAETFRHDPAVTTQNNVTYTIWGANLTVRGLGLSTDNGWKINGLPVYAMGLDIPYEHLESIQLLKGLTGFMYGFGSPGGVVNLVTKKPGPEAVRSVDIGYRSNSIWTEHVDLSNSYTSGNRLGYRINATHEEGRTYNDGNVNRNSVTLGLASHLTPGLTWSLDILHQERHTTGEISALDTDGYTDTVLPKAISASSARLATQGTFNDTNLTFVSTGFGYQISPDWKFSGKFGRTDLTAAYVKDFNYLSNYSGDYDVYLLGSKNRMENTIWQGLAQGKSKTGSIQHELVFGAERQSLNYDGVANGTSFWKSTGLIGNIYMTNPAAYTGGTPNWQLYRAIDYIQSAVFASDKIGFSQNWSILAGLRYNNYEQTNLSKNGSVSSQYKANDTLTPTVALMYKPSASTTVYGSYVQALESGGIVGASYKNSGEMLSPYKSKQYEFGAKTETDAWSATAALFRIERVAGYDNSQNVYVQNGLVVYQGLELAGSFRPTRNLTAGGGLMLLDPVYKRTGSGGYDGNYVSGTPRVSATAFMKYDVPQVPGLGLYADVKFTGKTYVDDANTLLSESLTLVGLGAAYATRLAGHNVTYRASVSNLNDRKGWTGGSSQIIPLVPRTFTLNAKSEF